MSTWHLPAVAPSVTGTFPNAVTLSGGAFTITGSGFIPDNGGIVYTQVFIGGAVSNTPDIYPVPNTLVSAGNNNVLPCTGVAPATTSGSIVCQIPPTLAQLLGVLNVVNLSQQLVTVTVSRGNNEATRVGSLTNTTRISYSKSICETD